MRKITLTLVSLVSLCLLAPVDASAQGVRYKWRDAEGNLHYSDSLPANAGKFGYDVISPQGVLMKRVEPAKSAEELAVDNAAAAKQRSAQLDAEARARNDQQLLAGYPTEHDLVQSHQQQLEMLQQTIKGAELGLQSQERSLADQLGVAADFERDAKPVPAKLVNEIGEIRKMIETQHGVISRRNADLEKARAGFATELDHYRALKSQ
ncbi:MAG: DUF4124 domain-containing protein [Dokdonella sp.]